MQLDTFYKPRRLHNFSGIGIDIKSPSALREPLGRILEQHTLPLFDVHGLVEDDLFEILLLNDFDGFVA